MNTIKLSLLATLTLTIAAAACDVQVDETTVDTPPPAAVTPQPPAQAPAPPRADVPVLSSTHAHQLRSDIVGETYRISVAVPEEFIPGMGAAPGATFPVIYVLDGYWAFGGAAEFARTQAPYSMPHAIVVGIAYDDQSSAGRLLRRSRDFTPTSWDLYATVNNRQLDGLAAAGVPLPFDRYPMGGADRFLDFVERELKPFIAARYPVNPADSTVVGTSFGGLLAAHALFTRPAVFQRYVIVSPGLNWDDGLIAREEQAYASSHTDLPAAVFLAAGGREREQRMANAAQGDDAHRTLEESYRMVERVGALAETLRGRRYPGLDVKSVVIEGENHVTTAASAVPIGLRAVFGSKFFFDLEQL
ncbi:MAG: alpha/beta hydrolase [Myxococcales bacterium]|nr:alpha/beta hydrolase [Myxococcales bacterium]